MSTRMCVTFLCTDCLLQIMSAHECTHVLLASVQITCCRLLIRTCVTCFYTDADSEYLLELVCAVAQSCAALSPAHPVFAQRFPYTQID
jgi:hypothetical protein